ncbi:MAG: hypothetical protein DME42_09440 [Verrucomicrobia bacterium]|nr:MAG: hypothetical protein DME42_09440 [Verrucomicrobiota bacterium]
MLSFIQLLILQGGKESPQFEATFLIAAKPSEHRIAARHFWIEANVAKRFAASDPVTDFVHNFSAANCWPTTARGDIAYVHAKNIRGRSRMRLFMRSSDTVLVYYLRKASIVFSIALTLGSASLEMTQRAPGWVMLSRSARLNWATGKSLPCAKRANDWISLNASRWGPVSSWSNIL